MKQRSSFFGFLLGFCLSLALLSIAAVNSGLLQTSARDFKISNTNNTVASTIQKSGTQSSNAFEVYRGGTLEFAIPGTNAYAGFKQNLGIQTGRGITTSDGTVTNVFSPAFSSIPVVTVTPFSTTTKTTNFITRITTSNFVWNGGGANANDITNEWIAIGPP